MLSAGKEKNINTQVNVKTLLCLLANVSPPEVALILLGVQSSDIAFPESCVNSLTPALVEGAWHPRSQERSRTTLLDRTVCDAGDTLPPVLSSTAATASWVTEELNFSWYFILISLNVSGHLWLVAMPQDRTAPVRAKISPWLIPCRVALPLWVGVYLLSLPALQGHIVRKQTGQAYTQTYRQTHTHSHSLSKNQQKFSELMQPILIHMQEEELFANWGIIFFIVLFSWNLSFFPIPRPCRTQCLKKQPHPDQQHSHPFVKQRLNSLNHSWEFKHLCVSVTVIIWEGNILIKRSLNHELLLSDIENPLK